MRASATRVAWRRSCVWPTSAASRRWRRVTTRAWSGGTASRSWPAARDREQGPVLHAGARGAGDAGATRVPARRAAQGRGAARAALGMAWRWPTSRRARRSASRRAGYRAFLAGSRRGSRAKATWSRGRARRWVGTTASGGSRRPAARAGPGGAGAALRARASCGRQRGGRRVRATIWPTRAVELREVSDRCLGEGGDLAVQLRYKAEAVAVRRLRRLAATGTGRPGAAVPGRGTGSGGGLLSRRRGRRSRLHRRAARRS